MEEREKLLWTKVFYTEEEKAIKRVRHIERAFSRLRIPRIPTQTADRVFLKCEKVPDFGSSH